MGIEVKRYHEGGMGDPSGECGNPTEFASCGFLELVGRTTYFEVMVVANDSLLLDQIFVD